ncbi:potassium channel protein [Thermocladium modestius]|uniref:Potassium channel protein n=1 Tax=Thermocladium modestius TaxID=62609 RepID=A0A830GT13_9CREN|nr:potassium channel protein [Thermocladium modestius]GGP20080.1 potassium channel protein [Thermocladium modestius]
MPVIQLNTYRLMKRIRRALRSVIMYAILMFIAVLFLGALGIYLVEYGHNPNIKNFFDAVWFVMETITTVGYGDIVPQTTIGRVVDMVIMPIGIAVISILTASIATLLTERAMERVNGMKSSSKGDHVIILGEPDRAINLVKALTKLMEDSGKFIDVVYVSELDKPPNLPKDVEFIKGNPTLKDTLIRANIDEAASLMILPQGDVASADAKTLMEVIVARSINPNLYIVAELLDENNAEYALKAGANEAIAVGSLTTIAVATEAIYKGSLRAVMRLLRGDSEISVISSSEYAGLSFRDALIKVRERESGILIGILGDNNEALISPSDELIIKPSHELIVIKSAKAVKRAAP